MNLTSKQKFARWGSLASLVSLTLVFTQCVPSSPKKVKSSSTASEVEVSSPGGLMAAEAEAPSVGVKDPERLLATMAAVTGVDPNNNNVRNAYNTLRSQLPSTGRIDSLTEQQMVQVTKLAAEFCNELVNTAGLRTAVWPTSIVNMDQPWKSATGFPNSMQRGTFVVRTLEQFWGADVQEEMVYEESYDVLMRLFSDVLDGPPEAANNNTSTRNAAKAVCTAALSGSPVWMD